MERSITEKIEKGKSKLKEISSLLFAWTASSREEKKDLHIKIENFFKSSKTYISHLKMEIVCLTDEDLEKKYREELQELKQEYKNLWEKFENVKNDTNAVDSRDIEVSEEPIDSKNIQKDFKHEENRVKESDIIMDSILKNDREYSYEAILIRKELDKQNKILGNIKGELSEFVDYP